MPKKAKETKRVIEVKQPEPDRKLPIKAKVAIFVIGALIIVLLFLLKNPKLFIAAVVNNRPITTWEFNSALQKRFGAKLLDQMIDERLIQNEATKQNIKALDAEINEKLQLLEEQVGGKENFNQLLVSQGLSIADLRQQIELKILVDKMVTKNIILTAQEIEDFMVRESASLPATDSASQKKFAEETLRQEKLTKAFDEWYKNLKDKAKIYKFY